MEIKKYKDMSDDERKEYEKDEEEDIINALVLDLYDCFHELSIYSAIYVIDKELGIVLINGVIYEIVDIYKILIEKKPDSMFLYLVGKFYVYPLSDFDYDNIYNLSEKAKGYMKRIVKFDIS